MRGESSGGGAVTEGGAGEDISAGESQQRLEAPSAQPAVPQELEPEQPSSARWLRACIGKAEVANLGATMLQQQDTLQQQVPPFRRSTTAQLLFLTFQSWLRP